MDQNTDNETFKIKKVTMWQALSGFLGLLLIISIFTSGFRFGEPTGTVVLDNEGNNNVPTQGGIGDVPTARVDVAIGDDPVNGTPAFFINGQLVSGAQPFVNFKTIIDAELTK